MDDPAAGITDLVLAAALLPCAVRLGRAPGVRRVWALVFAAAAAGALAGAGHHLVFAGSGRASRLSWVAVGVPVAVALSALLAVSAAELLDRGPARWVAGLGLADLLVYLGITVAGAGRTRPLVLSESVTMAAVVGLWLYGAYAAHPGAGRMLVAIGVCALSTVFFALPAGPLRAAAGLDARSLQHVGQIPGLLLLARVVAGGALRRPAPVEAG